MSKLPYEQLNDLKEMLDNEIITQDEFNQKKQQLLYSSNASNNRDTNPNKPNKAKKIILISAVVAAILFFCAEIGYNFYVDYQEKHPKKLTAEMLVGRWEPIGAKVTLIFNQNGEIDIYDGNDEENEVGLIYMGKWSIKNPESMKTKIEYDLTDNWWHSIHELELKNTNNNHSRQYWFKIMKKYTCESYDARAAYELLSDKGNYLYNHENKTLSLNGVELYKKD